MGYTHDTEMAQFVPPSAIMRSAGAWSDGLTANVLSATRAAAAAAFNLFIPVPILSNYARSKGARLKSIDFWFTIGVAAMTSVATVELEKLTLPANAVAPTAAAVAITLDAANDTTAKRKTIASHLLTATVTNPEFSDAGDAFALYLAFDAALGTTFVIQGARINYDLRI
jgi:hypothetical protein